MKEIKIIEWTDSFGGSVGWEDITDFKPKELIIQSVGFVLYEDDVLISLTGNYSNATDMTSEQANGTMTIPKCCIKSVRILNFE